MLFLAFDRGPVSRLLSFTRSQGVDFIVRPEVFDVVGRACRAVHYKEKVVALLSEPGTAKSRALDELTSPSMLASCTGIETPAFCTALACTQLVRVSLNDGNGSRLAWEREASIPDLAGTYVVAV